jgi:hypothetical protein
MATTAEDKCSHAHYLRVIASSFDDYCSDTPDDMSDNSNASSPTTPLTPFEEPAPRTNKTGQRSNDKNQEPSSTTNKTTEENRPSLVRAVPVAKIEGPLMSLWPLPIEHMEYEWSDRFYE